MHDQRDSGATVVVAVAIVIAVLFAGAVIGVGYFWLRTSRVAALEQRRVAEQQLAVAEKQRQLAEEHLWGGRDLEDATNQDGSRDRFESVQQQAGLVQQQFDEIRRTWDEIVSRTDGKLTPEDTEKMEAAFMVLRERLKQLDEVFQ